MNAHCLVCQANTGRFWFSKNNCHLYRCTQCKLIFPFPLPTGMAAMYSTEYFCGANEGYGYSNYEKIQRANNYTFHKFLDHIETAHPKRGKLLDVGAATGTFLETARTRDWEVEGIEISAYAAEQCQQKGLQVITGTLETAKLHPHTFDVITLWDVFEHVADQEDTLRHILKLLRPGGILALNMPDAGSLYARTLGSWWPLIVPPEHLFLFNKRNADALLNRFGFKIVKTAKVGKRFNPSYILQVLYTVRYQAIWKKMAALIKRTPIDKIQIPLNLRDNIFIIAKAPQVDVPASPPPHCDS